MCTLKIANDPQFSNADAYDFVVSPFIDSDARFHSVAVAPPSVKISKVGDGTMVHIEHLPLDAPTTTITYTSRIQNSVVTASGFYTAPRGAWAASAGGSKLYAGPFGNQTFNIISPAMSYTNKSELHNGPVREYLSIGEIMQYSVRIEVIEGRSPMALSLRLPASRVLNLVKSSVFVGKTFDNHAALSKGVLQAMDPVVFAVVSVSTSVAQNATAKAALSGELCSAAATALGVQVAKLSCHTTTKGSSQLSLHVAAKPRDVPTGTYQALGDKMKAAAKAFETKVRKSGRFAGTIGSGDVRLDYVTSAEAYDIDHAYLPSLGLVTPAVAPAEANAKSSLYHLSLGELMNRYDIQDRQRLRAPGLHSYGQGGAKRHEQFRRRTADP